MKGGIGMSYKPEEALGPYRNSIKRYLAKVIGWHIEEEIGLGSDWRKAWKDIVAEHFKNKCIYCGIEEGEEIASTRDSKKKYIVKLEKEHLISVSNGGLDIKGNLAPACRMCNSSKGDRKEWEEFIDEMEGLTKEERFERKEIIRTYIENECEFEKVKKHRLYKMNITSISSSILELEMEKWVTNWLNKDLYEYVYHLTTAAAVKSVEDSSDKIYRVGDGEDIKCAYEHQIVAAINDRTFDPSMEEELILLAIKQDDIGKTGCTFEEITSVHQNNITHIKGDISVHDFKQSKPFMLENFQSIKSALHDFEFSLTKAGIEFPGYDYK